MKLVLGLTVSLFSFFGFASSEYLVQGTIEDAYCGEVDPMVVGDVCLVYTTDLTTGEKYGLVYDDYEWSNQFVPGDSDVSEVVGNSFLAKSCGTISSSTRILLLQDHKKGYFYLDCSLKGFEYRSASESDLALRLLYNDQRGDDFSPSHLPTGYAAKKLEKWPEFTDEFKLVLEGMERISKIEWQAYVDAADDEFYHLTAEQRAEARANPQAYLNVRYLNQISGFYKLFKDGEFIGYAVDVDRMVRSEIIQDGSGQVLYLDKDLRVLFVSEWDA